MMRDNDIVKKQAIQLCMMMAFVAVIMLIGCFFANNGANQKEKRQAERDHFEYVVICDGQTITDKLHRVPIIRGPFEERRAVQRYESGKWRVEVFDENEISAHIEVTDLSTGAVNTYIHSATIAVLAKE